LGGAARAVTGGIYSVGSDIARNVGLTPDPTATAQAQAAMQGHPYASTAGKLIGGTAVAIPLALGGDVAAGAAGVGTGLGGSILTGAATGAAQNALAGNPDEPWYQRAGVGAALGGALGGVANKVGNWFGAGRSIEPEVADAAKTAQREGVTDIAASNLPGGNVKAMGAPPTYAQSGQIDSAVGKILGKDVSDWKAPNLSAAKTDLGQAVTKAAQSGQINAAPGGAFDQALTQVQRLAQSNGAGSQIDPLINQIRSRIKNGVISGQDFDNLVGAGSALHDLVGSDQPFVKQAAQLLDKVMDTGFQASSPAGAFDNWVDARTRYRLLMGVEKAVLPNGHINPTTLFSSVLNRFTDLKGVPVSSNSVVGRLGDFASSIRTLFGGGSAPAQPSSSFWRDVGLVGAAGGAPGVIQGITSGEILNPANYLSPAALILGGTAAAARAGQWAGQAYQQSRPFVNALINAGGAPIANPLRYAPAIGTQAFPQRQR